VESPPGIDLVGRNDLDVLEQEVDELCHSIRFHPGLLHDQLLAVLDFVVDEPGRQEVGSERNDELAGLRIGDECGDDDVCVDDQLQSSSLRRLLVDALASTLVAPERIAR
jgi:hypothetical protein